jgi:uncharacterized membrane-anchored protein
MEQVLISILENSIVGGFFVYMLFYITKNFKEALDKNTDQLEQISNTLNTMDQRISKLEKGLIFMDKGSVIRFLALIASLLAYFRIDVPETTIELIASLVVSAVGIYAAYKNNYLFLTWFETERSSQIRRTL